MKTAEECYKEFHPCRIGLVSTNEIQWIEQIQRDAHQAGFENGLNSVNNTHLEQAFKNGKLAGMTRAAEICRPIHVFSANKDIEAGMKAAALTLQQAIEKERDAIK